MTSDCTSHSKANISVDVYFTNTVFDTFLNFFYRYTIGFFHFPAIFPDNIKPFLWN